MKGLVQGLNQPSNDASNGYNVKAPAPQQPPQAARQQAPPAPQQRRQQPQVPQQQLQPQPPRQQPSQTLGSVPAQPAVPPPQWPQQPVQTRTRATAGAPTAMATRVPSPVPQPTVPSRSALVPRPTAPQASATNPRPPCHRVNESGQRCTSSSEPNSALCWQHSCPSCHGEKPSTLERCLRCQVRCQVCNADVGPSQLICGTCKGLSPNDATNRKLYLAQQAQKHPGAPDRWLFIWDFDKTITNHHVSDAPTHCSPDTIQRNLVDPEFFRACILQLDAHGHLTKIATWADGDRAQWVVSEYLAHLFGPNETRTVLHTEGIEAFRPNLHNMEPDGKNTHIRNLIRQSGAQGSPIHETRVVLFDDREDNIALARTNGYQGFHCPTGFTRHVWRHFTEACGPACPPEFLALNYMAATMQPLPEPKAQHPPRAQPFAQLPLHGSPTHRHPGWTEAPLTLTLASSGLPSPQRITLSPERPTAMAPFPISALPYTGYQPSFATSYQPPFHFPLMETMMPTSSPGRPAEPNGSGTHYITSPVSHMPQQQSVRHAYYMQ